MGKPVKCEICQENPSKYKCPQCITPYCSVACFKTHKQTPCSPPMPVSSEQHSSPQPSAAVTFRDSEPYEIEGPESADKVQAEKLVGLENSQALRAMLRNPHLEVMLRSLYASQSPSVDMEAAMREPIFVEFAEECLKVVGEKESQGSD